MKQAKLARDTERERLRLVKQSTIDRVKQAYYEVLQTQSALESIQEAITSYHELDRDTIDKVTPQSVDNPRSGIGYREIERM